MRFGKICKWGPKLRENEGLWWYVARLPLGLNQSEMQPEPLEPIRKCNLNRLNLQHKTSSLLLSLPKVTVSSKIGMKSSPKHPPSPMAVHAPLSKNGQWSTDNSFYRFYAFQTDHKFICREVDIFCTDLPDYKCDAFIQSDLQLIRLSGRYARLSNVGWGPCSRAQPLRRSYLGHVP